MLEENALPEESTKGNRSTQRPSDMALEEYKILIEERRFTMTRFMHALAFYLALMGFAIKELLSTTSSQFILGFFMTIANALAIFTTVGFRKMYDHATDRVLALASELGFHPPHPWHWGYWATFMLFAALQAFILWVMY